LLAKVCTQETELSQNLVKNCMFNMCVRWYLVDVDLCYGGDTKDTADPVTTDSKANPHQQNQTVICIKYNTNWLVHSVV